MDADHIVQLVVASAWALATLVAASVGLPVFAAGWRHRESERTRREIAAYVAEGSITAEDARSLMAAAEKPRDRRDARRHAGPYASAVTSPRPNGAAGS